MQCFFLLLYRSAIVSTVNRFLNFEMALFLKISWYSTCIGGSLLV